MAIEIVVIVPTCMHIGGSAARIGGTGARQCEMRVRPEVSYPRSWADAHTAAGTSNSVHRCGGNPHRRRDCSTIESARNSHPAWCGLTSDRCQASPRAANGVLARVAVAGLPFGLITAIVAVYDRICARSRPRQFDPPSRLPRWGRLLSRCDFDRSLPRCLTAWAACCILLWSLGAPRANL